MPGTDDLDRRLRAALRGVPSPGAPEPGARQALLAGFRRRRARRRQVVASGAVVVLLAAGAAAYGLSGTGRPSLTASAPPRATANARAPKAVRPAPTSSAGDGETLPGLPALSCVQVRVGGAPAACAGAYSSASSFGADGRAQQGSATPNPPTARAGQAVPTASAASAAPEELRVGESIAVALPPGAGLAWGAPHVGESTLADAGSPSKAAVVRLVTSGVGHPAGSASATFVATHPGVVVLAADADPVCGASQAPCGSAQVAWSLQVTVEGS